MVLYSYLKKDAFVKRPKETRGGGDPLEVMGARPISPLYMPKRFFDVFFRRFGTPLYMPKQLFDAFFAKNYTTRPI